MGLSQSRTVRLGHSNVIELPFFRQFLKRLGRPLDWNCGVHSSTLEQVQFLCTPEVLDNVVHAASQTFLTIHQLSRVPGEI